MLDVFLGLVFVSVSYLMGSIPSGFLLTKYLGKGDIRTQGSGNIGATNVLRNCGKKLGAIVLLSDVLKGFIPVIIAKYFGTEWAASLSALAAVLGHIFPVWLDFKGGKGVATTLAVYAALSPGLFIVAGLCWLLVFFISRISSLSSIATMVVVPVVAIFFAKASGVSFVILILSVIVIYKHKDNILRLMRGEEAPIKKNK